MRQQQIKKLYHLKHNCYRYPHMVQSRQHLLHQVHISKKQCGKIIGIEHQFKSYPSMEEIRNMAFDNKNSNSSSKKKRHQKHTLLQCCLYRCNNHQRFGSGTFFINSLPQHHCVALWWPFQFQVNRCVLSFTKNQLSNGY